MTQDGSLIPVKIIEKGIIDPDEPLLFIESESTDEEQKSPPRKVRRISQSTSQDSNLVESDANELGIVISDVRTLTDEETGEPLVTITSITSKSSLSYSFLLKIAMQ